MIQQLIEIIITHLREHLAELMANEKPEEHIVAGPAANPQPARLPLVALHPARFVVSQSSKDANAAQQPRPQPTQARIPVDSARPQGPYRLAHTPLRQSARVDIILAEGMVDERRLMLIEGEDFDVDYREATLSLREQPDSAGLILLRYAYVSIFTVQEFQQELLIDIYDDDLRAVEPLASLISGIILTNSTNFIETFNTRAKTEYQAGPYATTHTIAQINLLEGLTNRLETIYSLQLKFNVIGQLMLIKEVVDGFGLIEQIYSPGKTPRPGVEIDVRID